MLDHRNLLWADRLLCEDINSTHDSLELGHELIRQVSVFVDLPRMTTKCHYLGCEAQSQKADEVERREVALERHV